MFEKIKEKNSKKGLTLIELIVAIAVFAIVSTLLVSSYTHVMEEQRMETDMSTLNEIDISLKQILLQDDAFDEVKKTEGVLYSDDATNPDHKNKIDLEFIVEVDKNTGKGYVDLNKTKLNGSLLLKNTCTTIYQYLVDYIGNERIDLDSASYKMGCYKITIRFNGTKVSDARDYAINNDGIQITNSGDTELYLYN